MTQNILSLVSALSLGAGYVKTMRLKSEAESDVGESHRKRGNAECEIRYLTRIES